MSINPIDVALKLDAKLYTADLSVQLYELRGAEKKAWVAVKKEMDATKQVETIFWTNIKGLFQAPSYQQAVYQFIRDVKFFSVFQIDSQIKNTNFPLVNYTEILALEFPSWVEEKTKQRNLLREEIKVLNREIIRLHDSAEMCEIAFSFLRKGPNQKLSIADRESFRSFLECSYGEDSESKEVIRSLIKK